MSQENVLPDVQDIPVNPAVGGRTPVLGGRQMSAALREKLKKSGRSYKSPLPSGSKSTLIPARSGCRRLSSIDCNDEGLPTPVKNLTDTDFARDPASDSGSLHSTAGASIVSHQRLPVQGISANKCEATSLPVTPSVKSRQCKRSLSCLDREVHKDGTLESVEMLPNVSSPGSDLGSTCKRPRTDVDQTNVSDCTNRTVIKNPDVKDRDHTDLNSSCSSVSSLKLCKSQESSTVQLSIAELKEKKGWLLTRIAQKEEKLRKLKMVKMYRTKNDLQELEGLVNRWCQVSQEALQELVTIAPEPRPTLTQMVNHFQLDHELIQFCPEDESFDP